jgi:hypothetical protein
MMQVERIQRSEWVNVTELNEELLAVSIDLTSVIRHFTEKL